MASKLMVQTQVLYLTVIAKMFHSERLAEFKCRSEPALLSILECENLTLLPLSTPADFTASNLQGLQESWRVDPPGPEPRADQIQVLHSVSLRSQKARSPLAFVVPRLYRALASRNP
jgi:hypothetical protein